jgi:hypothetical protein
MSKEKKIVLIIVDSYKNNESANGRIINHLVDAFPQSDYEFKIIKKRMGFEKRVVTESNYTIFSIRFGIEDMFKSPIIRKVISKFRHITYKSKWPISSPCFVNKCIKKALDLNKRARIDCVIGVNRPPECLLAAAMIKLRLPNVKSIYYMLDTIFNPSQKMNNNKKRYFSEHCFTFEKSIVAHADSIIFLDYHKKYVESEMHVVYENCLPKITYSKLPIIPNKLVMVERTGTTDIIAYTGSDYYLPYHIFEKLVAFFPHNLFIQYGEIRNRSGLNRMLKYPNFKYAGIVPGNEITKRQMEAGFLINFESDFEYSFSSKMFQYISLNKPIICFLPKRKKEYIDTLNYPNILLVLYESDIELEVDRIQQFVSKKSADIPTSGNFLAQNKIDVIAKQFADLIK